MVWWQVYFIIIIVSLTLALLITPLCQKLAELTGFLDVPDKQAHKKHGKATPLMGGLAVFSAWLITIIAGYCFANIINRNGGGLDSSVSVNIPGMISVSRNILVVCCGGFLALLLGLYDDKYNMSARNKFLCQFVIAALTVSFTGIRITLFFDNAVFTWCISVFWYLVIFNSINFFDNMDGLAIGVAAIALSLFTIVAAGNDQFFVASLGAAAMGASIGFWFYNHSPATIFLGDAGSHFIGYILAFISSALTYYNPNVSETLLPVFTPLFILAIPLFDTFAVVVIRLCKGKPIYVGDHNHISHRFAAMGITRKQAVFLIHLLSLIIGLSVLPVMWGDIRTVIVCCIQAFVLLVFVSALQYSLVNMSDKK